jgi:hypothetical protein
MSSLDFNICRKVSEKRVFIIFHSSIVITIHSTCSSSHLGFMIIKYSSKHCRGPLAIFALKCFTGFTFREDKKLTDDGDGHHDIFKVMTKAHMALVNICYCWFVLPAIHVNNSMFIKNLSQHVENVTLLHIEINDHMSVSRLLLDNGCENLQIITKTHYKLKVTHLFLI